ncbi:MAG: hypothetical protein ABI460_14820 [Caldimonas sp.]
MLIFRWVIGVLSALFAVGAAFSFVVFISFDAPVWLERSRRLRHWLWLLLLFWFNVEVWGRVIWALFHWNSG